MIYDKMIYGKKELEQAIADKLNEIAYLFEGWNGLSASKLNIGISDDYVYGFVYDKEGNPFDFTRTRKRRVSGRIFTHELGTIIGETARECRMDDDDNPLCWASDEGVELMRQKLVFRLQEHDLMVDLKESGSMITIEKVSDEE